MIRICMSGNGPVEYMKKKIVIAVFLLVVSFLGAKAFVALLAYQTMEVLKQTVQKDISVSYNWISSSLDGSIVFHDVSITPFRLKRTFYVQQAELHYGSYINLLLALPELKAGSWEGIRRVVLNPVRIPFEGRDPEELLALDYGDKLAMPFKVYACGDRLRIKHSDLAQMGLSEIEGSLDIRLDTLPSEDKTILSLAFDMSELGKLQLRSDWSSDSVASHFSNIKLENLLLQKLSVSHLEGGYFRRLSNYCSELSGTDREHFSADAARQWRRALTEIGVNMGSELEALYQAYLLRGGQLDLRFNPKKPFSVKDFERLLDQDLVAGFGLEAVLNGDTVSLGQVQLDGSYFKPPEPKIELASDSQNKPYHQEAESVSPYLPISQDDLDIYLGKNVRIKLKDNKQFQGELVSINEQKLEIAQLVGGGKVAYFLTREQIETIEVFR